MNRVCIALAFAVGYYLAEYYLDVVFVYQECLVDVGPADCDVSDIIEEAKRITGESKL